MIFRFGKALAAHFKLVWVPTLMLAPDLVNHEADHVAAKLRDVANGVDRAQGTQEFAVVPLQ